MTFKQAFGDRLIVARFECGRISQRALAERADIHRTQVSMFETGQRMPMLETFVRLAGSLDQAPGDLLGPIRWVPSMLRPPGFFTFEEGER
jgi:transcriptional regulator with XRE-family HTH domain